MLALPNPVDVATGMLMERHRQSLDQASAMLDALARDGGLNIDAYAVSVVTGSAAPLATEVPPVIRRAIEFMDANAQRGLTGAEIAEAARIGSRGLQAAFRKHRDQSPFAYLHDVRMQGAHRDLVAGSPTRGDTVAGVAARWGLSHPGRFSTRYRNQFGCNPSITLRS